MDFKKAILNYIKNNSKFPTISELSELSGFSQDRIKQVLFNLEEEGFLDKLPQTGKYIISMNHWLRQKPQEEKLPEEIPPIDFSDKLKEAEKELEEVPLNLMTMDIPISTEKETEKKKPKANKKETVDFNYLMVFVLRSIMLLIGFSASIISIYYTSIWMLEFLPFGLAILLSSIMVLFSISSFEVVILFLSQQKKKHWARLPVIFSFSLLWTVVTVFSITSTIAGQYNKDTANNKEFANEHKEKTVEAIQLETIREQKKYFISQREEKQKQISSLLNISSEANSLATQEKHASTLNSISWRASQAEKQIADLDKQIVALTESEGSLLKKTPELASPELTSDSDFYNWLAEIFGVAKNTMQFWMSLFPAVFVDIISPASIAIAMFLKQEKTK